MELMQVIFSLDLCLLLQRKQKRIVCTFFENIWILQLVKGYIS